MNNIILDKLVIGCALLGLVAFILVPQLDISISSLFFDQESGFYWRDHEWVQFFYNLIPITTKIFISLCLAYTVYLYFRFFSWRKLLLSNLCFIVLSAAIGPGLVVNYVFKEHFGRARPGQVMQFNGDKMFTPAAQMADQCNRNCSFSSGHAGMAYYYSAFAYVVGKQYFALVYVLFLLFGTIVGVSRVMMGGHFASDVVSSLIVVLVSNRVIYILWQELKTRLKKWPSAAVTKANLANLKPK